MEPFSIMTMDFQIPVQSRSYDPSLLTQLGTMRCAEEDNGRETDPIITEYHVRSGPR
jgi:hypothetical protein